MFVGPNVYTKYARYIDLDDVTFFRASLETATKAFEYTEDQDIDKRNVPVCFASKLSAQTEQESFVEREHMYNYDRVRRKFIMLDADFNEDEHKQSQSVQESLISLAKELHTPLLIYPTLSYPYKPRFRAVLFLARLSSYKTYEQAVKWLYEQLGLTDILDASDTRITANRNLPIFTNKDQLEHVYSTLHEDGLTLLTSELWKHIKPAKHVRKQSYATESKDIQDLDFTYDTNALIQWSHALGNTQLASTYDTFWKIIQSIALEVLDQRIDESIAIEMCKALASSAPNEQIKAQWEQGNIQLLRKYLSSLQYSVSDRARTRPLITYQEYKKAIRFN